MNDTLHYNIINSHTVPDICETEHAHLRKPEHFPNEEVAGYRLLNLVTCTATSEVWYCSDLSDYKCIIKISNQLPDTETIYRLQETESEYLVPILDCGMCNDNWYEVYPFLKNGSVKGPLSIGVIREIILPGIIRALETIHQLGIIHNDIKPNNIYWNDDMSSVLLGDFGSALPIKQKPSSLTLSYCAPELLLNDVCRRSSDWCSVGLTIASLLDGKEIITANTKQGVMKEWEKGIRYSHLDSSVQQLINGMLATDPRKRIGPHAAKQWCGNASFGGEERTVQKQDHEQTVITVAFNNPPWIAADIEGLLQGIESHWEYAAFLFSQSKLDRFLSQFDKEWGPVCKALRKMTNTEDALYRLTLDLSSGKSYVWRGKRYNNLLEMEEVWERDSSGEQDISDFLQRGHVTFYLQKGNASLDKIDFVKRLQNVSRIHPFEACAQLFQALRGDEGLNWDGVILKDLNDVVFWLKTKEMDLDAAIDKVFESRKFEAWFAYQGMSDVLEDIRRKCEL